MTPEQIIEMFHLNDPNIEGSIQDYKGGYSGIMVPENMDMNKIVQAIIDDNTIGPTKAIIEFAQDSVFNENGVDYTLYVKPGEQLTSNTIIGQVTVDEQTKPIRSIFATGEVEATPDGLDYKRVFPDNCNRHIIINNFTFGFEDNIIDTSFIEEINNKFKNEAQLHQLITDNLCESVLPFILCKRYKKKLPLITRPDGRKYFSDFMKKVEKVREQYSKDMQKIGTEENIRKTNGNRRKMNALGDRIIERRYKHYLNIKDLYMNHRDSYDPCEYDKEYTDCKYLCVNHSMETMMNIGKDDYNNYYLALLSKVDISSNDNLYNIEYFDILSKIIKRRMLFEKYSIDTLIAEFNSKFKQYINENMKNAFQKIQNDLGNVDSMTYSEVQSWISSKYTYKNDEYTQYEIRQFTNMYLFIWTTNDNENHHYPDTEKEKLKSLFDLIKLENKMLCEFWDKCITEYETYTLTDSINEVKQTVNSQLKYAEWPSPGSITIDGVTYKHYIFSNTKKDNRDPYPDDEDEDLGMDYVSDAPEIPNECEVMQAPQDFLLDNEDDP